MTEPRHAQHAQHAQQSQRVTATEALADADPPLLDVAELTVRFTTPDGPIHAVNGVDLQLHRGQAMAVLGESGSGKSVTMQAVMGLVRSPPGRVQAHRLLFGGVDLLRASNAVLRGIRGPRMGMVFQDPFTSLDPTKTVGQQIGEMFRVHRGASRADARRQTLVLMDRVRIPSAARRIDDYPHQFSGGMSQRIVIAGAIALGPDLLIADEPTTALDVTVQAQIMDLLAELRRDLGMALILITHDLRLAAEVADQAAVMYAGRFVETGSMAELFHHPRHPYTIGLLRSLPDLSARRQNLQPIAGSPPVMSRLPPGCAFQPRCPRGAGDSRCSNESPRLRELVPGRAAACHYAEETSDG